jgi:hypothetical protein
MKRKFLVLNCVFYLVYDAISQPITLPKPDVYNDTANSYYLSLCEEYFSLFERNYGYHDFNYDTCKIDFEKYDLKGTRINGELKWELVSPKKYSQLPFHLLYDYDTINWKVFPRNVIIDNHESFNLLKQKAKRNLIDTFDFNKIALIYNDVWIDCSGFFYYKIEYDPLKNTIICNIIEIYGGSRGMCPKDSWLSIAKPKHNTKIVVKGFWVN